MTKQQSFLAGLIWGVIWFWVKLSLWGMGLFIAAAFVLFVLPDILTQKGMLQ